MEGSANDSPAQILSLALLGVLTGLFVWAFLPAWTGLLQAWQGSEDYAHGFFIVPLALYLAWRDRSELRAAPRGTSWAGLGVFLLALGGYLFGIFAGVMTLAYLGLVLAVAGGVAFLFGGPIARRCAFPLFLLLFMVPMPAQIHAAVTAPLQLLVSKMSAAIIRLLGIPVYREGNILHLAERSFQVIQACSGLRSIISLLTVSLVLAFLTLRRTGLRLTLFLAGVPVAVAVNLIRVVLMILALHWFGIDLAAGTAHSLFGVGVFLLALALLFLLQRYLYRWETASEAKRSL
jgi:exosortase